MAMYTYYCQTCDDLKELIQIPMEARDRQDCRNCGHKLVRQWDLPGLVYSPTRNGGHS